MAIMLSRAARIVVLLGVATMGSADAAIAQNADQKTSRGRATAVTDVSLTIQTAEGVLAFEVDDKTIVRAAASPAGNRTGRSSARLTALIRSGQEVVVVHHARNGRSVATRINLPSATTAAPTAVPPKIMIGTVKSITASELIVRARQRDARFIVDSATVVIRGNTESPSAAGAKPVVAVRIGDAVRVSYRTTGNGRRALEIRVNAPGAP